MFAPLTPMTGPLGILYSTRAGLVVFGIIVVGSGLTLLLGKLLRKKKLTGRGLMAVYLCFLFATLFQGIAFDWMPDAWVSNAIATIITAALWVWWKFKTEYIDIEKFKKEVADMQ